MSSPIAEVHGLTKEFRLGKKNKEKTTAVDNVSFLLKGGQCLGIVGESGSGKSTLVRMLMGLEQPTSGSIYVCGEDRSIPASSKKARMRRARQMQMVFQDSYTSLDRRQTAAQCLDEVLRLHFELSKQERAERINALGEQVGLTKSHLGCRPGQLSGGQRQRLGIARALAAQPNVIVLDESVSALDVSVQAQVLNLLADIKDELGVSYIFISHDLAVINQIADYIIVMRHGKIVESGPTAEVLTNPRHPYTALLKKSIPSQAWRRSRL